VAGLGIATNSNSFAISETIEALTLNSPIKLRKAIGQSAVQKLNQIYLRLFI